jgi:hypothetical protein
MGDDPSPLAGNALPLRSQQPDSEPSASAPGVDARPELQPQEPQSEAQTPQRPYEKTPARVAAALANIKKAQAALRESGYKHTEKRDAANLANLQKANAARRRAAELEKEHNERFERSFLRPGSQSCQ